MARHLALSLAVLGLLLHVAVPALHHGPAVPVTASPDALAGHADHGQVMASENRETPCSHGGAGENCGLTAQSAKALLVPNETANREPYFAGTVGFAPFAGMARAALGSLAFRVRAPPFLV